MKASLTLLHRDFPYFIHKVIADDISLDANIADDVLWVVVDCVLGVKVGVLAQAPQVEVDGLLVSIGYLAACALLVGAGVLMNVLIFLLDSKETCSTEIISILTLGAVIPVGVKTGAVVIKQPFTAFVMNQCCPRGEYCLNKDCEHLKVKLNEISNNKTKYYRLRLYYEIS